MAYPIHVPLERFRVTLAEPLHTIQPGLVITYAVNSEYGLTQHSYMHRAVLLVVGIRSVRPEVHIWRT